MSKTIKISLGGGIFPEVADYLKKIGLSVPQMKKEESIELSVEVRDVPEIIYVLERNEYFELKDGRRSSLPLIGISHSGLTLYLVTHSGLKKNDDVRWQQGQVFIPMDNIIAIHDVNDEFMQNLQAGNF